MKQQKKLQVIQYSVIGLLIFATTLGILTVLQLSQQLNNFDKYALPLTKTALFTQVLQGVGTCIAIWFIYRLVNEIRKRRAGDCELYLSEAAVKGSTNGIIITDDDVNIVFVNPAFEEITGYSAQEVNGANPRMLSSGHHSKAFFRAMWDKIETEGKWSGEIWNRRKDGEIYLQWIDIIKFPRSLFNTGKFLAIFSDITERKLEEGQQAFQATHDPLTKLPNRNLFFDHVENEFLLSVRNRSKLIMLFLDLDAFKPINDTYGHIVGDQVLIDVSNRIRQSIRQSDTTCRYGGDEFIVLLSGISQDHTWKRIAKELLTSISQPYTVDGQSLNLSVSIGVAVHEHDDEIVSVSEFINRADEAMYTAKVAGKNQYFLAPSTKRKITTEA